MHTKDPGQVHIGSYNDVGLLLGRRTLGHVHEMNCLGLGTEGHMNMVFTDFCPI